MKTMMPLILFAGTVQASLAGDLTKTLGFYHWGGQYAASPSEGVQKIADLGSRQARLYVSPKSDIDYHQGTSCSSLPSLAALVQQPDIKAALDNPNIDVFMLTAYDFTTFGDCQTHLYLNPGFYTPANINALVQEYSDLTLYLYQTYAKTYKRFIISNWESDNDIYCGDADSYAARPSSRESCDSRYQTLYTGNPGPKDSLAGLKLWFQYRQAGIADGRIRAAQAGIGGMRVYFAPEFNIVHALHDAGFESVLYDVLPSVMFDYVSYSAYQSIDKPQPADTLTADLNTIRDVTGSSAIIVGEMGFSRSNWGAIATSRTDEVLGAAQAWGVAYVFVWNLYDTSATSDYGVYGTDGTPTSFAEYYRGALVPTHSPFVHIASN